MNENANKSNKKIIMAVCAVVVIAAIIFFMKSTKKTVVGTWSYDKKPEQTLIIYENGSAYAERKTWQWTYEGDTLTLYPDDSLNNNTVIYTVVLEGDTMTCTTPGGYTASFTRVSK